MLHAESEKGKANGLALLDVHTPLTGHPSDPEEESTIARCTNPCSGKEEKLNTSAKTLHVAMKVDPTLERKYNSPFATLNVHGYMEHDENGNIHSRPDKGESDDPAYSHVAPHSDGMWHDHPLDPHKGTLLTVDKAKSFAHLKVLGAHNTKTHVTDLHGSTSDSHMLTDCLEAC